MLSSNSETIRHSLMSLPVDGCDRYIPTKKEILNPHECVYTPDIEKLSSDEVKALLILLRKQARRALEVQTYTDALFRKLVVVK